MAVVSGVLVPLDVSMASNCDAMMLVVAVIDIDTLFVPEISPAGGLFQVTTLLAFDVFDRNAHKIASTTKKNDPVSFHVLRTASKFGLLTL